MRTIWLIGAHGAPYGFMDYSCRINRRTIEPIGAPSAPYGFMDYAQ
ncbi:MAG TPA: hypothetical protein PK693_00490 [Halothiobacillus sp.]|jgi:hypothetical protein|nr:hypothetical protein [Halothiobacillus sp.]